MKIVNSVPTKEVIVDNYKPEKNENITPKQAEELALQELQQIVNHHMSKGSRCPKFRTITLDKWRMGALGPGESYSFESAVKQLYPLWDNPEVYVISVELLYHEEDNGGWTSNYMSGYGNWDLEYLVVGGEIRLKEAKRLAGFTENEASLNALQDPRLLSLLLRAVGR